MDSWSFDSRSPEETLEAGRELGRSIGAQGLVIGLVGPLAAGKTVFVKGLAEGLGVDPRTVSSPTFVIAQQYVVPEGPEVLHHIDLYRLESEDELESIGFFDMFAAGAVLAAEWADRFPGVLGQALLMVELEGPSLGEGQVEGALGPRRRATVTATGSTARHVLSDWAERYRRVESERSQSAADADGLKDSVEGARPGVGSFVERRLGALLLFALLIWSAAQLDSSITRPEPCGHLLPLESDAFGTSRAACLPAGESVPGALGIERVDVAEVEGVARLLTGQRIDLNRAKRDVLEALPGVGPKRAEAILTWRRERPFRSVAELERVPGIGPKIRARLETWLEVAPRSIGRTSIDG